ncbi:glutathione S-transferase family protein [Phenylobacterium sp.]|jgi:GST-like protein|uniref:glutathione S-transferase family protein n=1 Tax=Phenylobacterium sp. TaxID=1871053 RepID=UPI0025F58B87|nr:glutathione S-transferase family protein [Phenylobacterium sp.]MCA3585777.1 glutathione S-transferase family protein [Methylocystis sp.]MCA6286631.1 glutathione S-transferase family protein [Phenylobacterium sp.]MCA6288581.1 glutathione S-transferase family protein [Phenylobacterium sp.]MCA6343084.1 glutathione S-transferase family protein [Phenylobacterium sp.]MCA6346221.1 glutathione S-transferase family protein [Phenylobacterium sp.]
MIELWSVPTANGQKVHIALEEAGLPYRATMVDLTKGEHRTPEFLALNPFGKTPVMRDPDGPGGRPLVLAETLAIAWYAAEKGANGLTSDDPAIRAEQMMWASAISSSVAMPFAMQFFATQLAPTPDPWLIETMTGGARRSLDVFEARLADRAWVCGEAISVVDCLLFPVVATSAKRLEGWLDAYPSLRRWHDDTASRPAVQRGMAVGTA